MLQCFQKKIHDSDLDSSVKNVSRTRLVLSYLFYTSVFLSRKKEDETKFSMRGGHDPFPQNFKFIDILII